MVAGEITGMEEKQMKDEIFDRKIKELADSYSEVPSPDQGCEMEKDSILCLCSCGCGRPFCDLVALSA